MILLQPSAGPAGFVPYTKMSCVLRKKVFTDSTVNIYTIVQKYKLLPNVKPGKTIVMDNTPDRNVRLDKKFPKFVGKKEEILV